MTINVLLLDFDGVVLESVSARDDAFSLLFEDSEDAATCEKIVAFHRANPGIDRSLKIERIYKEVLGRPVCGDEVEARVARFGEIAYRLVLERPFVPGLENFLERMRGRTMYVISAARQDEVRAIAQERGIDRYFTNILGSPEKKAALIARALETEAEPPNNALLIGDKISDYNAAAANGVLFIGRTPSGGSNPFPADIPVIEDFEQGRELLGVALGKSYVATVK